MADYYLMIYFSLMLFLPLMVCSMSNDRQKVLLSVIYTVDKLKTVIAFLFKAIAGNTAFASATIALIHFVNSNGYLKIASPNDCDWSELLAFNSYEKAGSLFVISVLVYALGEALEKKEK